MEKKVTKRQKLDLSNMESDGTITITTSNPSQKEEKEKGKLEEEKKQNLNEPLSSERCQDYFMNYQGKEHVLKKLNRPFQIDDEVVLLKNIPESNLYKGYLCIIDDVEITSDNPEDSRYHIHFESEFDSDDRSRQSIERFKDFDFSSSYEDTFVSGNEILRLETQDLRYRTSFE